uniref:SWIM zinc finger family protein n=1 Tax=Thaumasiovibrio occultus TaxID=1891184 RepID=UPI000B35DDBF|nr:SWIM zinc finger family protein [Thaumasiovibrio occultus]
MNEALIVNLTSQGMVKRARKALQKNDITWDSLRFRFDSQQGHITPQDIQDSSCSCGIEPPCKHIVAAWLDYIEHHYCEDNAADVIVDLPALFKSAGRDLVRQVYDLHQLTWSHQIKKESGTVSVAIEGQTVQFQQATQMPDLIGDERPVIKLLAVYLYQLTNNDVAEWPKWLMKEREEQLNAHNTHLAMLQQQARQAILHVLELGVSQVREFQLIDFQLLIIPLSKFGARDASNICRRIVGAFRKYRKGEGIRDEQTIIKELCQLLIWIEKLPGKEGNLRGVHNDQLTCVGGYPWQSDSGAHGLTMVFQANDGQWLTASELRAKAQPALDLETVWRSQSFWPDSGSPAMMTGKVLTLRQGEFNEHGQLKRTKSVSADIIETAIIEGYEELEGVDWYQKDYVVIRPKTFFAAEFDTKSQVMRLAYEFGREQIVTFSLPYNHFTVKAILNLHSLQDQQPELVVCQLVTEGDERQLRPFMVKHNNQWVNLYFDKLYGDEHASIQQWIYKDTATSSTPPTDELTVNLSLIYSKVCQFPHITEKDMIQMTAKLDSLGLDIIKSTLRQAAQDNLAALRAAHMLDLLRQRALRLPVFAKHSNLPNHSDAR